MPKPNRQRRWWIKVWTKEWLDGTIRFDLGPVERSIWIDLLALAGDSRTPGVVQSGEGFAYPHNYLAHRLNIPLDTFEKTLTLLMQQQRVSENNNGITIINWDKYQSAYETKMPKSRSQDPDKYIKGKYGHMVNR